MLFNVWCVEQLKGTESWEEIDLRKAASISEFLLRIDVLQFYPILSFNMLVQFHYFSTVYYFSADV